METVQEDEIVVVEEKKVDISSTPISDILAPLESFFPIIVDIAVSTPAQRQNVIQALISSTGVNDSALVNRHAQELHQLLMSIGKNVSKRRRAVEESGHVEDIFQILRTALDALGKCAILNDPALQALLSQICAYSTSRSQSSSTNKSTSNDDGNIYDPLEVCGKRFDPFGGKSGNSNYYDPLNACNNDSMMFSGNYDWCW